MTGTKYALIFLVCLFCPPLALAMVEWA